MRRVKDPAQTEVLPVPEREAGAPLIYQVQKARTQCPTPSCQSLIQKSGDRYHAVVQLSKFSRRPEVFPEATLRCLRCGGFGNETGDWIHECSACLCFVLPGELKGALTPHLCSACEEKFVQEEIKAGKVCSRCGLAYSRCTC